MAEELGAGVDSDRMAIRRHPLKRLRGSPLDLADIAELEKEGDPVLAAFREATR
jgi:hypothetical protein